MYPTNTKSVTARYLQLRRFLSSKTCQILAATVAAGSSLLAPFSEAAEITGELKKWHKITLTFEHNQVFNERSNPNPFTDYRLEVTFSNGTETFVVPGYFAADGNAAETSATGGNKWRAHFSPNQVGQWNYEVSFRQGSEIAVSTNPSEGSPLSFHGEQVQFEVTASDKSGRDFRRRGRLSYVGEHYPVFAETGEPFLKQGPDAPENIFAYEDFDATPNAKGLRKSWAAHQTDFSVAEAGSQTWQGSKGSELLGAIHYLSSEGLNAFSFLTFNVDGDDQNVFPHLLRGTPNEYQNLPFNRKNNVWRWHNAEGPYHDRFDVSKMAQWERIFEWACSSTSKPRRQRTSF